MRIVFGNWKYILKNIWFVLPFSIVPAVFLALSLDFEAVGHVARAFFTGTPNVGFVELFRAWSFVRIDSWLGAVFSVIAFFVTVLFMTLMLSLVEKHMRIGKRTLSGAFSQFGNLVFKAACIVLLLLTIYEIWAVVLSAVLFAVMAIKVTAVVYILYVFVLLGLSFGLLYLLPVFYLWFPCMQITGFRPYDAFLYSYRLMVGVRWKIMLSMAISYFATIAVLAGCAFLPEIVYRGAAFLLFVFLFMSYCVRMETVYFEMDKIDREDILRSYRELL